MRRRKHADSGFAAHAAYSAAIRVRAAAWPGQQFDIPWAITLRGLGNLRVNGLADERRERLTTKQLSVPLS